MTSILIALALLTYTLSPANACGIDRQVDVKSKEPLTMSVCANVVDGVCDMERNPNSPECLALTEPSAGDELSDDVTVEYDDLYTEVQSYE